MLIRIVIANYLRECGFKVLEASDAGEAIDIMNTDRSVRLVFTDVRMPGQLDGFGLSHWVRNNRLGVPVALTSGDSTKGEAARKLCQDDPFFTKPYDLMEVVAFIRRTMVDQERKD